MQYTYLFLVSTVLSKSAISATPSLLEDLWVRQDFDSDFSHFVLWMRFSVRSEIECIHKCQMVFGRGCGYHTHTCSIYLDWNQSSNWTREDGTHYFLPKSVSLLNGNWVDMRRSGLSFAMLVVPQTMPWIDAKYHCEELGGSLYVMDTLEKRQAIIDEFHRQGLPMTESYWLGHSDRETEGKWVSTTGEQVDTFWANGEPSDSIGLQNCGSLQRNKNFTLDDDFCSIPFKSICELSFHF